MGPRRVGLIRRRTRPCDVRSLSEPRLSYQPGHTVWGLPGPASFSDESHYRFVGYPMYLAYVIADIGYNFREWNLGTVLMVLAGWTSLLYRIRAEERILSQDPRRVAYTASVRRLILGIW